MLTFLFQVRSFPAHGRGGHSSGMLFLLETNYITEFVCFQSPLSDQATLSQARGSMLTSSPRCPSCSKPLSQLCSKPPLPQSLSYHSSIAKHPF